MVIICICSAGGITAETVDTGESEFTPRAPPGEQQSLAVEVAVPWCTPPRPQCGATGLQEGITRREPFWSDPPLVERTEDRGEEAEDSGVSERRVTDNRASLDGRLSAVAELGTVGLTACGDVHWLAHWLRDTLSKPHLRGGPEPTESAALEGGSPVVHECLHWWPRCMVEGVV